MQLVHQADSFVWTGMQSGERSNPGVRAVDVRSGHSMLGALDEDAVLEPGAGADQGNQVGAGDRPPSGLGGFHELEHHREGCGGAAGAAGDLGAEFDGGERRLNGVCGPQVDPVLGRKVVERQQFLGVVGDLRDLAP
jgi:hypothetical protein